MGCSAEQRAAHTHPSSTTLWLAVGVLGLAGPVHLPHCWAQKRLLVGSHLDGSLPQGPGVLLCSKLKAVLELALLRLCHPVHHPGLAVGPTVAGDGVHSSFIFNMPLWEAGLSLLE